jgi:hypothetical protein
VALVFNLFVDAGIIPREAIDMRYEYLIEASYSIVSSLHNSHSDMGVQLAIRLLAPHATSKREVAAAIGDILEHYTPSTEQYAHTAISLCTPLMYKPMKQKSNNVQYQKRLMILDGCISVLVQLYRQSERRSSVDNVIDMTHLLLEGIDYESDILPKPWLGTCYRLLEVKCHTIVLQLLQTMVPTSNPNIDNEPIPIDLTTMIKAEQMSNMIQHYISNSGNKVHTIVEVVSTNPLDRLPIIAKHLINLVELYKLYIEQTKYQKQANYIIEFLSNHDSISTQSLSIIVKLWILRLARYITMSTGITGSSNQMDGLLFDLNGVTILLRCLSEVASFIEIENTKPVDTTIDDDGLNELTEMKLCFQTLLQHTICIKNTMQSKTNIVDIKSSNQRDAYSGKSMDDKKQFVRNEILI